MGVSESVSGDHVLAPILSRDIPVQTMKFLARFVE